MTSMKTEIKGCLCANLDNGLDAWIIQSGFVRRKNTLVYARELTEAVQKIEVAIEIHPKDQPDAAAVVFPFVDVRMDAVNSLVMKMVNGDGSLIGAPEITLREPIAFTSGNKGLGARWPIFQPDSVPEVVSELRSFLQRWTIPFLDSYKTPPGICEAYDRGDARVITHHLHVAAAMALCGRTADAVAVMERHFGRPGPRKRYQRVFDYLIGRP